MLGNGRLEPQLNQQLQRDAAVGVPVAALGSAVLFAVLAVSQEWIGPTDRTLTLSATPWAVCLYSLGVWLWLRRRPASTRWAHPILLSLCLAISVHHAVHLYVLETPPLTTNAVLAALACAYFFSSRSWFLAAISICILSWVPAAAAGGPFSAEWRHWTATFASGMVLAIAAFEARRLMLIRVESMRILSDRRKADAEQALAQAELANAERLEMETAMHESQRRESLGMLAGGIAHDFNNLLMVISGNVELAQLAPRVAPETRETLRTIASAADRAAKLTRQLLVYSGRAQPTIATVDLGPRIHDTAGLFRSLLRPNVTLTLDGREAGVTIEADAALLDQVIINLVQNAIEACADEGGRIEIRWGYEEAGDLPPTRAFIDVSDTGCGMDRTARRRMFEPFFTTKKDGTGLGMAAVKGIADSHGAEVQVRSEPGGGTTIRFSMPVGPRERPERAAEARRAPPACGSVMIVDDQDAVRRVARGFLEAAGYAVHEAGGGREALALLEGRAEPPGAVLVDLTMPDVSGSEVARRIRQRFPRLPVVFMSGFDADGVPGESAGVPLPFLQKPFSRSQLLGALARAVGEPH